MNTGSTVYSAPRIADFAPRHFLNHERLANEFVKRYEAALAAPDPRGYTVVFPESFRYADVSHPDETCGHVHATVDAALACRDRLNDAGEFGDWTECPPALRSRLEERS